MPTTNESMHTALQAQQLLPISARLTTGSFVMITEGVAATITFMMPRNHWLYLAGLLITLAFLGGAELFRRFSKVGADISDLFFWDAVIWAGITAAYFAGVQPTQALYFSYAISLLKLWRLYMWQGTATYEQGWGVFGPMTYLFAKGNGGVRAACTVGMYRPLLLAACVAAVGSVFLKGASEPLRVAIAWLLPLGFELIFGPRQLATLAQFVPAFLAGNQREAAQLAEIAELKKALAAAKQSQAMPPDPNLAALIACYNGTTPKRRKHLLFYATNVAELFPEGEPDTDT